MSSSASRLGLVLSAGGARAAYQVGVIRFLAEAFPGLCPSVYTGVSAGSINACYLSQGLSFSRSGAELYGLWESLYFEAVFRTNFKFLSRMFLRWAYDLFLSKVTQRLLLKSLFDATPLATTLLGHIHFWKISRAVRAGQVLGVALSATNYHDGFTTVFFDSTEPIIPWQREQRRAIRTALKLKHVMASCSIPILFEPVRIGDFLYGDGALRFGFPLSPAIHLGATHLFAVSTRARAPENALGLHPKRAGLGFIAGAVLNSIFLDNLETDFENLTRINHCGGMRVIPSFLIRPSRDLGALAAEHLEEVPFHLRQLLRSTATARELGDLLSYLMFSPAYLRQLLMLGYQDAQAQRGALEAFLEPFIAKA